MYKQSPSLNSNILFTNINQYQNINTPLKDFGGKINNILKNNDKCQKHKEPYIKYCTNCSIDICQYCASSHDNHLLINYDDISPDEEEINLLKNTIKKISEDYAKLLEEIIKWKKNLEEKIFYFERLIEKNEIINDIDFVYNFNNFSKNYTNIIKFRQIFSSVISPEKSNKNNNIMKITRKDKKYNMGYYNYFQYNISKTLLELLINNNNNEDNIINENDNSFIYKGNLIIKYLWDSFIKTNNENNKISRINNKINIKINTKKIRNSKSYYNTGTYCGPLRLDNDEEKYNTDKINDRNYSNKQSKIIEKHIDLKMGSKKSLKKNININNSSNINKNPLNNNIFAQNNKEINHNFIESNKYETEIYNNMTLPTSYSSQNLLLNNNLGNSNNNNYIYLKQNNKNKIYEKLISYTPLTLNNENNNQRVYSKKRINNKSNNFNNKLNQTSYNIINPFNLQDDDDNHQTFTNNNINKNNINNNIISLNIPKKIRYMGRSNSLKYINKNTFNPDKINDNILSKNINHINSEKENEIITSKYIPEIRARNLIYNKNNINNNSNNNNNFNDKKNHKNINNININTINNININNNNQGKTFKHKKLNTNFEVIRNINNDAEKLNQTQLYNKPNDNLQEDQLNNSNILNSTFTQYPFNSNIQKNIIISKKENQSDTNIHFTKNEENTQIKSSLFPNSQSNQQNSKNNNNAIRTIKNNPDTKYLIDPNEPLCMGLDLDNSECKISLVNQTNGDIELFCFEKEQYSIPTVISFNDKSDIIIGNEAKLINITNPSQTIFNLLKMVGKNYNEIKGMKEIWPFKIYSDGENERPYIKINLIKKEKKFYIEDLLNLFLKKLFEKLFKKIIFNENEDENNKIKDKYIINIILVVTVPNTLNYFQRKVIEKIFQRQIFPEINIDNNNIDLVSKSEHINGNNNNENYNKYINKKRRLYNGYQINLKKIKIENASSIATLCLKGSKKNELKDNNSLIINIGGGSINLSITSINTNKEKKLYEVKALNGAEFGEEDFIDNFVYDCLKEFDENIYKECISTPGALAKLRRSCSIAQKYFDKNSQIEIKVSKLYGTIDLKMILTKSDYEKACNDLFKKINLLIKEILKKSKLSEINIDNILLIGSMSRSDKIKNILKELFKHNRLLYNKLSSSLLYDNDNDYYLVIGAALQAANLIIEEPKYIISDITPMSFGVETINGLMEFVVEKGVGVPVQKEKFIKIKNDGEKFLEIKIYEGEDINVNKNRLISSANIDKRNFKMEKMGKDFIEILIQFEIDSNLNLCVYVLDVKTFKRRFECLINIDIVKN